VETNYSTPFFMNVNSKLPPASTLLHPIPFLHWYALQLYGFWTRLREKLFIVKALKNDNSTAPISYLVNCISCMVSAPGRITPLATENNTKEGKRQRKKA